MKRERVLRAIQHKNTDIDPFNAEPTIEMIARLSEYLGLNISQIFDWSDNHIEKFSCKKPDTETAHGYFTDEYGVTWNRTVDRDIGMPFPVFKEPELKMWQPPSINKFHLNETLNAFVNNGRDTFKFAKIDFALFERAWSLRGFENLLADFLLEPSFVHGLLEIITERNINIINEALLHDIDGIYFGDDYGQQTGMLFSPQTWREFIKPQLARMFEVVKKRGKIVCLHSCGDIWPIIGDLIDIGLDVYQTIQPEVYDLHVLKNEYGNALCFYGGISTQCDLPVKSPDEIRSVIQRTI
jgi:uroporphyrinogen decarboxylase